VVFFYTACKKTNTAPAEKTVSEKDISSQIALNLSQSFNGAHGGVNLSDGIKAPALIINNHKGLSLNAVNPVLCGFRLDTTVNYSNNTGGTQSTIKGRWIFAFTCSNGIPGGKADGIKVVTSLVDTGKNAQYTFDYFLDQIYDIKTLNAQNTLITLNGPLTSIGHFIFTNPAYQPASAGFWYKLNDLHVDLTNNADVISGTATFTVQGNSYLGKYKYIGNIVFLGNHMIDITINGKTYKVDLLTGKVI
jgi:hypothetical protein